MNLLEHLGHDLKLELDLLPSSWKMNRNILDLGVGTVMEIKGVR